MKSEIINTKPVLKYPCLMINKHNHIILMSDQHTGTVVYLCDEYYADYPLGQRINDITCPDYKLFEGKVILSNPK